MILAHGLGGRTDLPLPIWLFIYGAGAALLVSFVALRVLWPRPLLRTAAVGRDLPGVVQQVRVPAEVVLRIIGLFVFAVVVYAAIWGVDQDGVNIAPVSFCVMFWVVVPVACAVLGDIWAALNPFDTIAVLLRIPSRTARRNPGQWTAAVMIFAFVWLELAYYDGCSHPRVVALWLVSYSLAALAGAVIWGRDWLRFGEGFAGLFGLISHLSPLYRHRPSGRLRWRWPVSGLSDVEVRRGTAALVFVALGSTAFDGFTGSSIWRDVVGQRDGWSLTIVNTVGLLWVIGVVAIAYYAAARTTARIVDSEPSETARRFLPSLIPIIVAYTIAHYFSLVVFEGQNFLILSSDPFGRGWDLFGTIDNPVNYLAVSTRTIAYVQVGSIVVGHVLGVMAAHDRAVESYPPQIAVASQYPFLAVMVVYTVVGLGLLLAG